MDIRAQILRQLDAMAVNEGTTETVLDEVTFYRASQYMPKQPLIYSQGFCIALQGFKACYFGGNVLTYGHDQYLVVPTILPAKAEVFPEDGKPLLAISIAIDHEYVHDILDAMGNAYPYQDRAVPGIPMAYLESFSDDLLDPLWRLLQSLGSRGEAEILAKPAIREVYYRALLGANGHILASVARSESHYDRICQVLRDMHDNYATPIDVTALATNVNMSARAFYKHFKAVTSLTPVQYLKRIRLEKARHFLVAHGQRVSVAAQYVGYESVSQFSREFKRHFGYPPREALQRNATVLHAEKSSGRECVENFRRSGTLCVQE
ncbi:AraC family transcriptional regulator [Desulfovibrio inopinatus]|uniref:AraC family transcriptional regulator n=1 Tax=Desulfovibrio inopinatus TaxID=102109 RepID=UPI00041E2726|nr:AraC family transcriptional regulator [Desulfovibrio inopinatus]